ncbi:MAG: putative Brix domain-containing ribosomal biogenesis protein [Candidatus Bathyarchaeota archaeon BA1]|nr:MAG: putative Brix domain-containing ribosomal biogenesis protein [Candidatus Bathyarchaeota archaeon BA1]
MILLTTSRRPTRRIRTLCHDLARSIPNVVRINRGKLSLDGLAEKALELDADRVIVVDRWRGGPGKIELFQTGSEGLIPLSPLIYVVGIRLQREFRGVKTKPIRPLAITTPYTEPSEVLRFAEALSHFLNVPMLSLDSVLPKYSASMHISSDAPHRIQVTFVLLPQTIEIGPRITISHVVWEAQQ